MCQIYSTKEKVHFFFFWIYNNPYGITSSKYISLNFIMKKYFEHHIDQSNSKVLVFYFYYSKVSQILYSIKYKPNGKHHGSKMKFEYTFLCFCQKLSCFLFHSKSRTFNYIFFHAFTHFCPTHNKRIYNILLQNVSF
jgi:hypothetical protein